MHPWSCSDQSMLSMWAYETLFTWQANVSTINVVTRRDKDKIFIWTSSTIFKLANTRKFRIGQNMNNILLIQCTLILHRYGYIWWCNKWTVLHQYGANSDRQQNSQEKLQQQAYNCLTQWNFVRWNHLRVFRFAIFPLASCFNRHENINPWNWIAYRYYIEPHVKWIY